MRRGGAACGRVASGGEWGGERPGLCDENDTKRGLCLAGEA